MSAPQEWKRTPLQILASTRSILWRMRVPVLVLVVLTASLLWAGQFLDICRAYALEPRKNLGQILAVPIVVGLISYQLLYVGTSALSKGGALLDAGRARVVALAAMYPTILTGAIMMIAGTQVSATEAPYATPLAILTWLGAAISIAGCAALLRWWLRPEAFAQFLQRWCVGVLARSVSLVVTALIAIAFLVVPLLGDVTLVATARSVGPVAIVLLALSVYLVGFGLLAHIYDRYRIPALTFLILFCFVSASLSFNNNHIVRPHPPAQPPIQINTAFADWVKSRQPLHPNEPVPVFVIATQGGGLYAARYAASVLARIQDDCPAFAQHIFAISGVSGGSVGAAVFASAVSKFHPEVAPLPCKSGGSRTYQHYVRDFLERDFLSPILWQWLIPDIAQTAIPYPPIEMYDRGRALEFALEQTDAEMGGALFSRPVSDTWAAARAVPALFLNTTRVGTGEQLYAAPIAVDDKDDWSQPLLQRYKPNFDVRVSTAASLSARLPVIQPAATLDAERTGWRGNVEKFRISLMDGALAENSGLATTALIVRELHRGIILGHLNAEVYLVAIGEQKSFLQSYLQYQGTHPEAGQPGLSQTLTSQPSLDPRVAHRSDYSGPFAGAITLNTSRQERSAVARNDLSGGLDILQLVMPSKRGGPHKFWLPYTNVRGDIPLAWYLSKLSHDRIGDLRAGVPSAPTDNCVLPAHSAELKTLSAFGDAVDASMDRGLLRCALRGIQNVLSAEQAAPAEPQAPEAPQ